MTNTSTPRSRQLITVDGKDTTGYDMENVRGTLMGRCGSLVCLGIRPRGAADGVEVQVGCPALMSRVVLSAVNYHGIS